MSKHSTPAIFKTTRLFLSKHSPEILTGAGIIGMVSTTVMAVRATPRALRLIEEAEIKLSNEHCEDVVLTPVEKVKVAWKPYVPAVITGIASITCLVGANSVSARRTAAIAAAYQISETALSEYREKVVETIGEKKEATVREKVNQKQLEKTPVSTSEVIITGTGTTLCLEPLSRRYFEFDVELIKRAENTLNKQMLHDICGSVSLNDFYDEIGLETTELGETLGWNTDNLIDLDITPGIADNGKPCLVIGHHNAPKYNFY